MRKTVLALALVATLTACTGAGDDGEGGTPVQPSPSVPTPTASGGATSTPGGTPDLGAPQEVASGLDVPWGMAFLPDGDALVAERETGRVVQVSPGGGQAREVYEVSGVDAVGEGGLLGLAVSPGYAQDRWVYAYYTSDTDNRIVRFQLGGGRPEVIFDGIRKGNNHNGGRIKFGPDGMLYAGTGDAGDTDLSQDADSPNGKILRLTPEGEPAPGNPRAGSPVYTLGHRNVQGLAWDSGGRMYGIEFGQNRLDEVNRIEPGRNYGWPEVEGEGDTDGGRYTNPIVTWPTDEASPSGATVAGNTLYVAALRGERLWTVPLNDGEPGEPRAELVDRYGRLRTVEVAPDGALWLSTSNRDGRGDVRGGDDRVLRHPAQR
ncbi:PQQ-dependent sugar dehydrogenase [Phytohabitans kaempferiae]|uniref:PQQ-dependent sugar dehydrogenase n=1 Tax=Phytohabitans kaempferiae TaxID=1620943 RepID=A0ABV6M8T7_9ACTN